MHFGFEIHDFVVLYLAGHCFSDVSYNSMKKNLKILLFSVCA